MENKTRLSFKEFVKQYLPLIIIVGCILAILTVVLIVTTGNDNTPVSNNPVVEVPDNDDNDKQPEKPKPENPKEPVVTEIWGLPVSEYEIGMDFSLTEFTFSQTTREWLIHKAIDFLVPDNAPVMAVLSGKVESVNTTVMDGTVVTIVHKDGMKSIYASLGSNVTVKAGDTVSKGTVIGYATDSGYSEFLEGAHLHFELLKEGKNVNPKDYLPID